MEKSKCCGKCFPHENRKGLHCPCCPCCPLFPCHSPVLEEEKKCPHCNDKGYYVIPVSSPIMAPYGKDNTTSVPCECKISGTYSFKKPEEERKSIHTPCCYGMGDDCPKCNSKPQEPMEEPRWCVDCFKDRKLPDLIDKGCKHYQESIPQEPIEWESELKKEFHSFSVKMAQDVEERLLNYSEVEGMIVNFWLSQIKQAEERGRERCRKESMEGLHDMLWNKDGSLKSHEISDIVSGVMHYFMK